MMLSLQRRGDSDTAATVLLGLFIYPVILSLRQYSLLCSALTFFWGYSDIARDPVENNVTIDCASNKEETQLSVRWKLFWLSGETCGQITSCIEFRQQRPEGLRGRRQTEGEEQNLCEISHQQTMQLLSPVSFSFSAPLDTLREGFIYYPRTFGGIFHKRRKDWMKKMKKNFKSFSRL